MAEGRRSIQDYMTPNARGTPGSIATPNVEANNFELKPTLIIMVHNSIQFEGMPNENPNMHLTKFLRLTDTIKYNRVSNDAIRLHQFPFSVSERVQIFYSGLSIHNRTTIDDAAGGSLIRKDPDDAYRLIDEMASASFQWHTTDTYNLKRKEAAPVYQAESSNPLVS
ncbi:uncharacterized protein LOC113871528 [Abrus precatorius]|uniref:Uncharacterized protein LOC113871528 n=1 Tax=Abrus precatorius TaxID=3816 RepID=A0A8B8M6X0_ABRPR|nr:uncharacterized protein LOC113871528 [Abrus precatorius]